jgi:hypothetical protein
VIFCTAKFFQIEWAPKREDAGVWRSEGTAKGLLRASSAGAVGLVSPTAERDGRRKGRCEAGRYGHLANHGSANVCSAHAHPSIFAAFTALARSIESPRSVIFAKAVPGVQTFDWRSRCELSLSWPSDATVITRNKRFVIVEKVG